MQRRRFIKSTCSMCLAVSAGLIPDFFLSCSPYPVYEAFVSGEGIEVPIGLFAESDVCFVRAKNLDNDIALLKKPDGAYLALLLRCTHADNGLTYTGAGFNCSLHGSTFDTQGRVTHGPAQRPLKQFVTEISSDKVIILTGKS